MGSTFGGQDAFGGKNIDYNEVFDEEKPYQPRFVRPDPFGQKKICREDMPIGGAKDGKYNLDWVDDQNEQKHILAAEDAIAKGKSPIYGMDFETYKNIIDEMDYQQVKDQYGVKNKFMKQFPIKVAQKNSVGKVCAICCNTYNEGSKVFFLPCGHHFHVDCIMPWFHKNHKCPTCRYDLNEGDMTYNEYAYESTQFGNPDLFQD